MTDHLLLISLLLAIGGILIAVVGLFLSYTFIPRFWGDAPFVGSKAQRVERMVRLAKLTNQDRVTDLGSGDGRIIFAAARAGVREAIGYEIHPFLVWKARFFARLHRLPHARFKAVSFWDISLRDTTVVFVYQLPRVMIRLAKKFDQELPPGARIVSNEFVLPGWNLLAEEEGVHLYQKELKVR